MLDPTPLERLDSLDQQLRDHLLLQPDFKALLQRRFSDRFTHLPLDLQVDQVMLGDRSLPDAVSRRLADPATPLATQAHYRVADTQVTLEPPDQLLLPYFIDRFCSQAMRLYEDQLTGFWRFQRPPTRTETWRQWLAEQRRAQFIAQLDLREQDQTLDAWAVALVRAALTGEASPASVYTLALRIDGVPVELPGSLLFVEHQPADGKSDLADDPDVGRVVLATLATGLETFASITQARQELCERFDYEPQAKALLSALSPPWDILAGNADALLFHRVPGDCLADQAGTLCDTQQQRLRAAWPQAVATHVGDFDGLSQALAERIALAPLIDSNACRHTRYALLLEAHLPTWLKEASQDDKVELVGAMHQASLATVRAMSPDMLSQGMFASHSRLLEYAREQLNRRLRPAYGSHLDADSITVSTVTAHPTGPLFVPTNPNSSIVVRARERTGPTLGLVEHRRSLTQLALENVALHDFDYWLTATITDANDVAIPGLTPDRVKGLVRELDVGRNFERHLESHLLHSTHSQWRRQAYAGVQVANMRVELLRARLRGNLGQDREERSLHWVQSVLGHPHPQQRPLVDGHRIEVQQLQIRNSAINGVLILASHSPASTPGIVVYTPDAPNRVTWKYHPDRATWASTWNQDPAMHAYFLGRTSLADRESVSRTLQSGHPGAQVSSRVIDRDLFDYCYESQVRLAIANADALSTSTGESNVALAQWVTLGLLELVSLALPSRILVPMALARALLNFWQAYDERHHASLAHILRHLLEGASHLIEATVAMQSSPWFAKPMRAMPIQPPLALNPEMSVSRSVTQLRFRIDGIYGEGVYERQSDDGSPSAYYIQDREGRSYQVFFDGERWRVVDNRNPDAVYKPVVQRNAQGEWELPQDIRWMGSTPDLPTLLQRAHQPLLAPDDPRFDEHGIALLDGHRLLRVGQLIVMLRNSLLPGRYSLVIPAERRTDVPASLVVRHDERQGWQIKVKQIGMVSRWLALP